MTADEQLASEHFARLLRTIIQLLHPTIHMSNTQAWQELTDKFPERLSDMVAHNLVPRIRGHGTECETTDGHRLALATAQYDEAFREIRAGVETWRADIVGMGRFPEDPSKKAQVERQLDALAEMVTGVRDALQCGPLDGKAEERKYGRPVGYDELHDLKQATCDWLRKRSARSGAAAVVLIENENASVHTLWLEAMSGGSGRPFQHPLDALVDVPPRDGFVASLRRAWAWALGRAKRLGVPTCDARWRLVEGPFSKPDGPAVRSPNGGSAAGAAARAWFHVLRRRTPDEEVVVLAGLSETGDLEEVLKIPEKVRAINDANRRLRLSDLEDRNGSKGGDGRDRNGSGAWFDTIIVASDEDKRSAEQELGTIQGRKELAVPIRVVVARRDETGSTEVSPLSEW